MIKHSGHTGFVATTREGLITYHYFKRILEGMGADVETLQRVRAVMRELSINAVKHGSNIEAPSAELIYRRPILIGKQIVYPGKLTVRIENALRGGSALTNERIIQLLKQPIPPGRRPTGIQQLAKMGVHIKAGINTHYGEPIQVVKAKMPIRTRRQI
ncbi:hypothetical protein HUU53_04565 [Candidatus Micrarchaeota archaeon]|nr:hypothetical protein [Candidatus Micrarchaeota archaeon]